MSDFLSESVDHNRTFHQLACNAQSNEPGCGYAENQGTVSRGLSPLDLGSPSQVKIEKGTASANFCRPRIKRQEVQKCAGPLLFATTTVTELRRWSDQKLREQGKIAFPMIYDRHLDSFVAIEWAATYGIISQYLGMLEQPESAVFFAANDTPSRSVHHFKMFATAFGSECIFGGHSLRKTLIDSRQHAVGRGTFKACEKLTAASTRSKALICLGGNFIDRLSSSDTLAERNGSLELAVHIATTLNRSHLVPAEIAILLPSIDLEDTSEQPYVASNWKGSRPFPDVAYPLPSAQATRGMLQPAQTIVEEIATRTLCKRYGIEWSSLIAQLTAGQDLLREINEPHLP
jgi:hypothetical protein